MQSNRYYDVIQQLTGAKPGYNPPLLIVTQTTFITIMSLVVGLVLLYFIKFGEEQLTRKHILICLGLWTLVKIVLIPS